MSVGDFFLNVIVTFKVRPGLARGVAPKNDCRRLIEVSKRKTRTPTHGRIMSICHPDCPYFSKRTHFSQNVIFSGKWKGARWHRDANFSVGNSGEESTDPL